MRQAWAATLSGRIMDPEGYVATHQHASIAHQLGWPFPFWNQGRRGCGWHFSFKNTAGPGWRPNDLSKPDGWTLTGARDAGVNEDGWRIEVTNAAAVVTAPPWKCHTFEVPFLQLRWQATGLGAAQPFVEWTTPSLTNFSPARRMYFEPVKGDAISYTMIPMYRHPQWTGEVAQLRIGLGNTAPGSVTIQAFFSQYDTRHNINSQNFVRGCAKYFWWTRDLGFLRAQINRMRTALRYVMTEHQALERKVVYTDWVGHDGRSGLERGADGAKTIHTGQGIGNNYWDLLPFGGLDAYATIQYYDAVRVLATIEREIREHPEWQIPGGVLSFDPAMLERHAAEVKTEGNRVFWNRETQRFNACVDADGKTHDYGLTFLNLEAVYYDFATPKHAARHPELGQRRPRRGGRHVAGQGHLPLAFRAARDHEAQPGLVFLGLEQPGEHSLGRPGAGRRRGARVLLPRSDGAAERSRAGQRVATAARNPPLVRRSAGGGRLPQVLQRIARRVAARRRHGGRPGAGHGVLRERDGAANHAQRLPRVRPASRRLQAQSAPARGLAGA